MALPLPPSIHGALESPTASTSQNQSQGEQGASPKQLIGLSRLDTYEKPFRYLDFAKGGTNTALNKWGYWNYISVEPRNIFRLEHIAPERRSHEEQEEEEDKEETEGDPETKWRRSLGWEPDNPEWEACAWFYSANPVYPRRHDKFNELCMKNEGLGLRFSPNTNITQLEHYYRNDIWPEIRYTVEGKVKVVLQHYIRDGEIIQDMCLTSESDEETELKGRTGDAPDHLLEPVPDAPGSHWRISSGEYCVTATLFEDGKPKPFSLLGDGKPNDMAKHHIEILSDDPVRHSGGGVSRFNPRRLFSDEALRPYSRTLFHCLGSIAIPPISPTYPQFRIPKTTDTPTRTDGAQGPMLPQGGLMNAGTTTGENASSSVSQSRRKSGKKGKCLDITTEDRRQVNDPPSSGEWYWFRVPRFMKHKPEKFEINRELIEKTLDPELNFAPGEWGNCCCFWETNEGKKRVLESIEGISEYGWGDDKNTLVQPYRKRPLDPFKGREASLKLQEQRDRKPIKKRIIIMEYCAIEHLISLMANLDCREAGHINEFLSFLPLMDSHEMRFEEKVYNLWTTEFNINFITAPSLQDAESPLPPNYFPRRRAKFLSINDVTPDRTTAEAPMGFRFIGDLHDRYWTCYVFYNFGSQELITDTWTQLDRIESCKTPSQRKCLEGFLVRQALDLVLLETKNVLDTINKSMGEDNKSQELFSPVLTENDLRGENYFKKMNKNSVFYPWLLDVYGALLDRCKESRKVAVLWITAEAGRKYKPRWSEKD
ncbi:hypothetical protein HOY82DRAFT_630350 [Tuber indicum]|nr:hypothetical protein HOY82DRAFT_630350 [Tuber indicum]